MRGAVVVGLLGLVSGCGDPTPPVDGPPVSGPTEASTETSEAKAVEPEVSGEAEPTPVGGSTDERVLDCEGAAVNFAECEHGSCLPDPLNNPNKEGFWASTKIAHLGLLLSLHCSS